MFISTCSKGRSLALKKSEKYATEASTRDCSSAFFLSWTECKVVRFVACSSVSLNPVQVLAGLLRRRSGSGETPLQLLSPVPQYLPLTALGDSWKWGIMKKSFGKWKGCLANVFSSREFCTVKCLFNTWCILFQAKIFLNFFLWLSRPLLVHFYLYFSGLLKKK